jgi:hypothetical protein|tara:strand:+ start:633 stop:1664 length:1032 start_codon:yes stop_codon:yes gene_type:complete
MSIIKTFIAKSISLFHLGNTWMSGLCADIFEASRTVSYVETVGDKADTLHKHISWAEERILKQAYELQIKDFLKKLRIKKVELAIDGKQDLYYGENGSLNVRQIKHENGADEAWEYIVISIIHPIKVPIMAVPYKQGDDLDKICMGLLEYSRSLPLTITKVLFDRGFYHAHLIDYLESKKEQRPLPYLILAKRDPSIKNYVQQTKGSLGVFRHTFNYNKHRSRWKPQTTIVVCKNAGKNKEGEWYDMIFATNLKPSRTLVRQYSRRWNIETGFRIMEEGKIKTKSNNPLIRLFYFLLRALLTITWAMNNIVRIFMTYKGYLRAVEHKLRVVAKYKPPPIQPLY